jgi:hypothetical protein
VEARHDAAVAVLSAAPVNNYQTVFGVVMDPGRNTYESRLWAESSAGRELDKKIGGGVTIETLAALGVRRTAAGES